MIRTHEGVLKDIQEHPEDHHHDFDGLRECCLVGGILHASLMEAHSDYAPVRINNGVRCDVTSGKCSCGETH